MQTEPNQICMADYVLSSGEKTKSESIHSLGEGCFTLKIGGTTYDVSTHFNKNGNQCGLDQFRRLILAENLI